MNIKIIITSIALLFSISAGAATVESLINTHGKRAIMDIIADKIHKKFTINVDGEIRQAHAPSEEYITTGTLATDIARAGMTPNSVETAFTERSAQARIQAEQKAEEHRRRLELAEKLLQKTMERRKEDAKILAGTSESEREQFRIAQANGARIEALRAGALKANGHTDHKRRRNAKP